MISDFAEKLITINLKFPSLFAEFLKNETPPGGKIKSRQTVGKQLGVMKS